MNNRQTFIVLAAITTLLVITANARAQQHADCPMMQNGEKTQAATNTKQDDGHMAEMNMRGDHAMGFAQAKTTHHFRLFADGGAIEVTVNELKDDTSRVQVRRHLAQIAHAFAEGNFETPMAVHDQVPPGITTMKQLKETIAYTFEETANGGRVRITTRNTEALHAIHQFLRFQIKEHATGDSFEVLN